MSLLLGFLGGLAAVALKGYIDLYFEERREWRALRAAARLLLEELAESVRGVELAIEGEAWPYFSTGSPFSTAAWDEYKPLLASALNVPEWFMVAVAYERVVWAREDHEAARPQRDVRAKMHPGELETTKSMLSLIQSGEQRLTHLADRPFPLGPITLVKRLGRWLRRLPRRVVGRLRRSG